MIPGYLKKNVWYLLEWAWFGDFEYDEDGEGWVVTESFSSLDELEHYLRLIDAKPEDVGTKYCVVAW